MIETRLVLLLKFLMLILMQGKENMGDFFDTLQGDSGGNVNILGGDGIFHFENKSLYEQVTNSEFLPNKNFWIYKFKHILTYKLPTVNLLLILI